MDAIHTAAIDDLLSRIVLRVKLAWRNGPVLLVTIPDWIPAAAGSSLGAVVFLKTSKWYSVALREHEWTHSARAWNLWLVGYLWQFVTSRTFRRNEEARAYAAAVRTFPGEFRDYMIGVYARAMSRYHYLSITADAAEALIRRHLGEQEAAGVRPAQVE